MMPVFEPFGIWPQGQSDDESDFFLYEESGDVSCPTCTKLFTESQLTAAYEQGKRDAIPEFVHAFKRHVGGDGEFWLHELEDFAAAQEGGKL